MSQQTNAIPITAAQYKGMREWATNTLARVTASCNPNFPDATPEELQAMTDRIVEEFEKIRDRCRGNKLGCAMSFGDYKLMIEAVLRRALEIMEETP